MTCTSKVCKLYKMKLNEIYKHKIWKSTFSHTYAATLKSMLYSKSFSILAWCWLSQFQGDSSQRTKQQVTTIFSLGRLVSTVDDEGVRLVRINPNTGGQMDQLVCPHIAISWGKRSGWFLKCAELAVWIWRSHKMMPHHTGYCVIYVVYIICVSAQSM